MSLTRAASTVPRSDPSGRRMAYSPREAERRPMVGAGAPRPDCYPAAAKFKRVYKISLKDADSDGFVKKIGYVDLLDIKDPNGNITWVAPEGGGGPNYPNM